MNFPENFKKRVTENELTIEGRTFRLRKFDPLLGNYILMKLFTMTLPFGIGDILKQAATKNTEMSAIASANTKTEMMSKADFLELQRDILSHCYEVLPAGETPVVMQNGQYGIMNFTMGICMQLLIATIAFNFNDFFEDVLSESESTDH